MTVVSADEMPGHYSGTPYKKPYAELSERCLPVYVSWTLLGASHTCAPRPHGPRLVWNERRLLLAGERVVEPTELQRTLREVGIRLELHDREPPPPPPPPPAEGEEGEEGAPAAEAEAKREGGEEGEEGAEGGAPAAAEEPQSAQHPPFGVARKKLSEFIPRRPTDGAPAYAAAGLPVRAPRRLTLDLEVYPCERPKQRPEPEEAAAEYYAGAYLEAGTELTVNVELAMPLPPEPAPRPAAELQRIVSLIRYADTPMLLSLLNVVKAANDAIGMNSASAWESYKESGREDLDLITGVQLVDEQVRLFVFEGQPARFEPLNAMGRLGRMLERRQPNSASAFTLMNARLTFGERLYNTFEMPTKLIKLRQPLPKLLLRPEIYEYLRVAEGCRDALLCLGQLLRAQTLLHAYKAAAFPAAGHLLQLEKKFGGVQLVVDREGVLDDDDDDDDVEDDPMAASYSASGGVKAKRGHRTKHAPRKAATDADNEDWYRSLAKRALAEPIDWLAKNIAELPVAPEPAPLPEWYLESIPQPRGPVYPYSGQRLNQTELQKEALRQTLATMHKAGQHYSYNRNFLWADSVGDRERRVGYENPDADLVPWDSRAAAAEPRRHPRALWHAAAVRLPGGRAGGAVGRGGAHGVAAAARARRPAARRRQAAAALRPEPEGAGLLGGVSRGALPLHLPADRGGDGGGARGARRQGDRRLDAQARRRRPRARIDGRIRDRPLQTDKWGSTLKDAPMKKSLKALYRGKTPMTRKPEVSAFMHEATIDDSLRERGPGLRATWTTMKWPQPK